MLDYIALGILNFAALIFFYGIIITRGIPCEITEHLNHPLADATPTAVRTSLLTSLVLRPFLWLWSTLKRENIIWV